MRPIFFSVAGEDIVFAESVWARFASDLIYLYSKTGRVGADFWQEIERTELPNSRAIVVFWSHSFAKNSGTQRELELAARLFRAGQIRSALLLRLDHFPIAASASETDAGLLSAYDNLRHFASVTRASETSVSIDAAVTLIDSLVAKTLVLTAPLFPRPMLEDELFRQARIDQRVFRPVVWVSGLNGQGRRTVAKEAYRRIDPNATAVEVDISEVTIPRQLVLRLESEAFSASAERLRLINSDPTSDSPAAVAGVVARIRDNGRYTLLRQQRVVEERVPIPEWLYEVFQLLEPTARPAAFVVSQLTVRDEILRSNNNISAVRVTPLLSHESDDFIWSLVRHFDTNTERWSDETVRTISRATGGNIELMISVVRLASRLHDLNTVHDILEREASRFSDSLGRYVEWALSQLSGDLDCLRLLKLLQDVNPASLDILRDVLGSVAPIGTVISSLQAVGLVDVTQSGLYRLSPLLDRRLNRYLLDREMVAWHRAALRRFVNSTFNARDVDHGYIRIEAVVNAALWSGSTLPGAVREFVSAAHWFQAGVRLYAAKQYPDAHSSLKSAFELRNAFRTAARLEVCRYNGLAAVRVRSEADVSLSIAALGGIAGGGELIDYIRGFDAEIGHRFNEAMTHYSNALARAQRSDNRDRQARIIRPLIGCILKTHQPDFGRAEELADWAVDLGTTVFSLMN